MYDSWDTDFIQNFPTAFRTQTLVKIWTTELEQRRQQPGEDVNTYAAALQELYRRVEINAFIYPEVIKARKFVNGLLPDLYVTVKPHNDQTWNGAVDRAKAYELTHQDQHAVNAYLNKFAPPGASAQSDDLYKAIQELTKQVQQLSAGNWGNRNNYQRVASQTYCQILPSSRQWRGIPNNNNNSSGSNSNANSSNNYTAPPPSNSINEGIAQLQQLLAQLVPQGDQSLN
ncbi:hypothetical protein RCL_jg9726.t1 [Rhizophagus clarus]|uniref:Retrotransposon gag domain-containing protein n=1 Tax=Rhizophagus clarus TaxID=94130 RepID=A0A8H3LYK3_9GLOM|nr:hypothetical protein RCL_jg9726.t1 [Rhizophagus clarus]